MIKLKKKIIIKLISVNQEILKIYFKFLKQLFEVKKINFSYFFLPQKVKKISLLRSPHVHKKSIEHFEITCYKFIFCFDKKYFNQVKSILINKPKSLKIQIKYI